MSASASPPAQALRPRPDLDDPTWGPHWRGLRERRLSFQQCAACSTLRWPPAPVCPNCLDRAHSWASCDPQGTIWSLAVYEHAYAPGLGSQLPYAVVLVALDCGINYISRIRPGDLERAAPDRRVSGVFVEVEPDLVLLEFELSDRTDAGEPAKEESA